MWFGTKNGLNRYDGLSVRRYNCYDPVAKRGNNNISSLYERNDTLWVGTDRGVYIYDMRRETFTHMGVYSREGIAADDWVDRISAMPTETSGCSSPTRACSALTATPWTTTV